MCGDSCCHRGVDHVSAIEVAQGKLRNAGCDVVPLRLVRAQAVYTLSIWHGAATIIGAIYSYSGVVDFI